MYTRDPIEDPFGVEPLDDETPECQVCQQRHADHLVVRNGQREYLCSGCLVERLAQRLGKSA